MNTVFLLVASVVNKLNFDLKIVNSLFKLDIKQNEFFVKNSTFKNINPNKS